MNLCGAGSCLVSFPPSLAATTSTRAFPAFLQALLCGQRPLQLLPHTQRDVQELDTLGSQLPRREEPWVLRNGTAQLQ